jgi:hypothetical protein
MDPTDAAIRDAQVLNEVLAASDPRGLFSLLVSGLNDLRGAA